MSQSSKTGWPSKAPHIAFLLALIIVLVHPALVGAQSEFSGLPAPGVPVFDLDIATFRSSPDSARLEIYYRITNPKLSYVRRGDHYVASYEISAVLTGKGDRQLAAVSNRENYSLPNFDETRRSSGYLVNLLNMIVPAGEFQLEVTLNDRLSGGTHTVKRDLDLRFVGDESWVIGGPEYFLPGVEAPALERYKKDSLAFVPNVTRSFGGSADRLAVYLELYQPEGRSVSRVVLEVRQRTPERHIADTITIEPDIPLGRIVFTDPLTGFQTGEKRLRVIPLGADGNIVGREIESVFFVEWSLESLVESDWKSTVEMLIHIATPEEMETLRATPADGRAKAFQDFWNNHDPSPETEQNEWRDEYYRRIRFANQQFTSPFRPGWQTDFGTVYIKYGEPDEIERYPFELGQKPFEIWYYYAQRRQFTFIDVRGNGEYELQYPYDGIIR